MYGKIVYQSIKTKKFYTYKCYSPYMLENKLKGLRKNKDIIIHTIEENW